MPFPLNKAPRGILEILRLRTLGKNPQFFSEVAQAFIDTTEYYGADLLVSSSKALGAGAMTRTTQETYTVPGRLFAVSGVLIVGAAAGTQIRLSLSMTPPGSSADVGIGELIVTAPVIGASYQVSSRLPKPMVCLPGTVFNFSTAGDAAGADHQPFLRTLFEQYTGSP